MIRLIKPMYIILVLVMLWFGGPLAIKSISRNNQSFLVKPTLIDLNLGEIHSYPFLISMDRCDGSCNTVKNPFGRICVPNKMEGVNLKVFNTIKGINESRTLAKRISCEFRCQFDSRKCNSRQKWNNDNC